MATKKQNDEQAREQATPAAPVDENQTASGMENSGREGAHGEAKASEVREAAPVPQENVAAAPQKAAVTASREPADGENLVDLAVLADRHRVPSWMEAALCRMMGWEAGKRVTDAAYKSALDKLKARRSNGTAALFAWGDREDWEKGKRNVNFLRLPEFGRLPSRQTHGRTRGRGHPFRFR